MFKLDKATNTPEVIVDNNQFKIKGVCTPENPPKFFEIFRPHLDDLLLSGKPSELVFHFDYFNTGSSKCLLDLFKHVESLKNKDHVKVTWVTEAGDTEMRESGELYADIVKIKFNFVEID